MLVSIENIWLEMKGTSFSAFSNPYILFSCANIYARFRFIYPRMYWPNKSIYLSIFTNTSTWIGYDTRSIFKQNFTGLNSESSFSLTRCLAQAEETSLTYYLPIAGGRTIGFIPFPRVLVLSEMLSVSSRIWTRVAVHISYDDNHYTTGTSSIYLSIYLCRYFCIYILIHVYLCVS